MLPFPSTLSEQEQEYVAEYTDDFYDDLLAQVETVLRRFESEAIQHLIYDLAFSENQKLPKRRSRRPKLLAALVAEQVYEHHADTDENRELLLQYAIVIAEHSDIIDDFLDGDVPASHQREALLVSYSLVSVLVELLEAADADLTHNWVASMRTLLNAAVFERRHEPTAERYVELLERQAELRGCVTAAGAILADAPPEAVERAASIGRALHKCEQLRVDMRQQIEEDDREEWNAHKLFSESAVVERIRANRAEIESLTSEYDEHRRQLILGWVSHDLDAYLGGLTAE